jgi:hypothetical protein
MFVLYCIVLGLCVTGAVIPFVDKLKLLGVRLDNHLTFDQHATCKKIRMKCVKLRNDAKISSSMV